MKFLYNKRKGVPLLRGRIYMLTLFIFPYFAYLVYNSRIDYVTRLAYHVYFLLSYLSFIASYFYHNGDCKYIDRTVYKRIDYAGIFLANLGALFPAFFYFIKNDRHVFLLVLHMSVNFYGVLRSLSGNFINTTKWYRVLILWAVHCFNHFILYKFIKIKFYTGAAAYLIAYVIDLIGAYVYSQEKPNLVPGVFEFHELAHTLYVIGIALVFCCNAFVTGVIKLKAF